MFPLIIPTTLIESKRTVLTTITKEKNRSSQEIYFPSQKLPDIYLDLINADLRVPLYPEMAWQS